MSLAIVEDVATAEDPALTIVSDAAGRMRVSVAWVRASSRRAVAVEEAVAKQTGVRAVHAYPRTGSVVVWYSPRRCDRSEVLAAISGAEHVAAELIRRAHRIRRKSATPMCCAWSSAALP